MEPCGAELGSAVVCFGWENLELCERYPASGQPDGFRRSPEWPDFYFVRFHRFRWRFQGAICGAIRVGLIDSGAEVEMLAAAEVFLSGLR